jgi:hypothetical protein
MTKGSKKNFRNSKNTRSKCNKDNKTINRNRIIIFLKEKCNIPSCNNLNINRWNLTRLQTNKLLFQIVPKARKAMLLRKVNNMKMYKNLENKITPKILLNTKNRWISWIQVKKISKFKTTLLIKTILTNSLYNNNSLCSNMHNNNRINKISIRWHNNINKCSNNFTLLKIPIFNNLMNTITAWTLRWCKTIKWINITWCNKKWWCSRFIRINQYSPSNSYNNIKMKWKKLSNRTSIYCNNCNSRDKVKKKITSKVRSLRISRDKSVIYNFRKTNLNRN